MTRPLAAVALVGGALLAALAHAAALPEIPAGAGVPAGALVIIGGALRPDNAAVWRRVVALAGGPGARIAVLPAAAGNPALAGATTAALLKRYGATPFVVPLAPRLDGSDYRKVADDAAVARQVRAAGGVYFVGGEQLRITQALLRDDGSRSAVLQAIWDLYRRGGVVAGTSAGAAIMSSTMFADPPATLALLRQGLEPGRTVAPGLGFIGNDVFIDQHFLVRGRFARMIPAMLGTGYRTGIGIDEDSAIVVRRQRHVEVLGYKGALLVDLAQAHTGPGGAGQPLSITDVALSYLDHGDRYDLATGRHVPGPDKGAAQAPDTAGHRSPVYSNDILGNNAVLDVMEKLVDSDQREAIGIASGDPRLPGPQPGFAFRFRRSAGTMAWPSGATRAWSIRDVRLDIAPAVSSVVLPAAEPERAR
ncbi:cyanophycinase [Pseudoduganella rivuli]|uniref:cyanophycinase n=1 Tax=Pseudoduganella rivuli TaxID=2666085 RepID=UPI003530588D